MALSSDPPHPVLPRHHPQYLLRNQIHKTDRFGGPFQDSCKSEKQIGCSKQGRVSLLCHLYKLFLIAADQVVLNGACPIISQCHRVGRVLTYPASPTMFKSHAIDFNGEEGRSSVDPNANSLQ